MVSYKVDNCQIGMTSAIDDRCASVDPEVVGSYLGADQEVFKCVISKKDHLTSLMTDFTAYLVFF